MFRILALALAVCAFSLFACASDKDSPAASEKSRNATSQLADLSNVPLEFSSENRGGCGDLGVWAATKDGKGQLVVYADRENLGLSKTPKEFDLANAPEGLEVSFVYVVEEGKDIHFTTCDDQRFPEAAKLQSKSIKEGKVRISISTDEPGLETYNANVETFDLILEVSDAESISLPDQDFKNILVGWFAG